MTALDTRNKVFEIDISDRKSKQLNSIKLTV